MKNWMKRGMLSSEKSQFYLLENTSIGLGLNWNV